MAGRSAGKPAAARAPTPSLANEEVDRLRMELDAANERIRVLEDERRQFGERVAWALETLETVLEDER
jgi:hypothetical protein